MDRLNIARIRKLQPCTVVVGNHRHIIQSVLDFDFLMGRAAPTVKAIVAGGKRSERFFFGVKEISLQLYETMEKLPPELAENVNFVIDVSSARRVKDNSQIALQMFSQLAGVNVFAEGLPERHAIELSHIASRRGVWILGGASVGLVIPNHLKLGAIGGVEPSQLQASRLFDPGSVAVISSSGGMVNELIRMVAGHGFGVSFAAAVGGDRFPMLTPSEIMLAAQEDNATKAIVYFGELGGNDEYEIAELLRAKRITKPVVAYIAGSISDVFESPPQFGHAKAMAESRDESAKAKREILAAAGALVGERFGDFVSAISEQKLPKLKDGVPSKDVSRLKSRKKRSFTTTISYDDRNGNLQLLGADFLEQATSRTLPSLVASMFLGKQTVSEELEGFVDTALRLLVDHGPYVSGAVNTMVAARAGKDLVSSLAAGLLTIGPRFGGAINEAANQWLRGVADEVEPQRMVEEYASRKRYLSGIGHKKYNVDLPDPRIAVLESNVGLEGERLYWRYARGIESITSQKKSNLILNVDGAIAAMLLDILAQNEGYDQQMMRSLVETEFFNGLFVLARSVGFIAHYFDQRRLDEGLFRLNEDDVAVV